ncbi:hypothetical protein FBT96_16365 [Rhodobacter capsulatus]|uniref:Flp pilus assembly protein, pilin Flp n=1 Tax=Rhodobacter capsulatus TaxID=1061 RepID=A0A4V5PQQ9_RHOCA|nr:hypothetical protein [Rhodobacter capsulatus]TKD15527.1 hypothetical protein FBT96_16365 [Rhodobacter capsulatus]
MREGLLSAALVGICHDDEGAITVDWVVLTAAVVSLGMVAGSLIWSNSGSVARNVGDFLDTQSVKATF